MRLEYTDNALTFVKDLKERSTKMAALLVSLSEKYNFFVKGCDSCLSAIESNKRKQVDLLKGLTAHLVFP